MREREVEGRVLHGLCLGVGVAVGFACAAPAVAQESGRAMSVDSASVVRESLQRPPARPPTDVIDVAQFPFRVALFPVRVVFRSVAGLAGLVSLPEPPLPVRVVRDMRAAGVRSRIRSIGPRSGPAIDFTFVRFDPFFIQSGISLVGSQRHRLGVAVGDSTREASLLLMASFRRDGQENFWGLGPDSQEADRSDFERETWEGIASGGAKLGPVLGRVGIGVETNRVRRGRDGGLPDLQDVFVDDLPFGAVERTEFLHLDLSTTLDLTRRLGFQDRGIRLRGAAQVFRGLGGTDSDFHRFNGEAVGYLPVSLTQTLAIRGLIETNDLDDGRGIPLFHQVRFGGSRNGPRGFSGGRFRDNAGVALMAEWRYEIWSDIEARNRAEAFLLFDEGMVASRLSALSASDLRASYGFGLRLVRRGGLSVLTYLAFSDEGAHLALKTQWPF